MRAWYGMKEHLRTHAEAFRLFRMNTVNNRGFMIICRNCTKVCKIAWSKKEVTESDEVLEAYRMQLRDFLGFGTRSAVKRQRMV